MGRITIGFSWPSHHWASETPQMADFDPRPTITHLVLATIAMLVGFAVSTLGLVRGMAVDFRAMGLFVFCWGFVMLTAQYLGSFRHQSRAQFIATVQLAVITVVVAIAALVLRNAILFASLLLLAAATESNWRRALLLLDATKQGLLAGREIRFSLLEIFGATLLLALILGAAVNLQRVFS